jgi:hypothetical protein
VNSPSEYLNAFFMDVFLLVGQLFEKLCLENIPKLSKL